MTNVRLDVQRDDAGSTASRMIPFRTSKSVALMFLFLGVGLIGGLLGPTFVSMERLLNTDALTLSAAVIGKGAGYLVGSLLCSVIFDRANKELSFALAAFFQGICTALAPITYNVYGFVVFIGLESVGTGFSDSGGNSYALWLWGGHKIQGPFMQGLHFLWSLGATLAPLIVRPFLVDFDTEITNCTDTTMGSNLSCPQVNTRDLHLVKFAYATIGSLTCACGILFFVIFIFESAMDNECKQRKTILREKTNTHDSGKRFTTILLCFLFMHFHTTVFIQGCGLYFLSPLVIKYLGWDNKRAALVVSVFQGAFGVGRLSNIGISAILSPRTMLVIGLTTTMCAHILMTFIKYHDVIIWISVAMAGFFQASTFPTSVLWASVYIKITGLAAGVFMAGSSSASLVFPKIVGLFFNQGSQMNMVYMMIGVAVLQAFNAVVMQLFAHFKKRSQNPKVTSDSSSE